MKHKVKNRMIKGVSLALAATAVTGLLLQTTMSVQAATAMPGIETIIKDNSEDQPFRILELVENCIPISMKMRRDMFRMFIFKIWRKVLASFLRVNEKNSP